MQKGTGAKLGAMAYLALFLGCLCYIATMYLRACPAILTSDLQASFGVDASGITAFSSMALLGYGIMQMPSGLITDALGGRKTLTFFMLLAAAATFVFANAASLGVGVAARFVTGLTLAAVPPLGVVLAQYFPRERYTQAMGLLMASGGLGSILAAEPLARLSIALGWRGAMLASAAFIGALGLAVFFILREGAAKESAARPGALEQLKGIFYGMKRIFRSGQYWGLAIWQIASSAVFFSFMSMWGGPYLMDACGLSKLEASRVLLVQGLLAMAAVSLLSGLADRLGSRRVMLVICSALGLAGSLGISYWAGALPVPLLILCIMALSVCGLTGATCVFSLIRRNFPPELTGTGIGCANMFWPLGAALLNEVTGFILDGQLGGVSPDLLPRAGLASAYSQTFIIYTAFYGAALLIALFFIRENFTLRPGGKV